MQVNGERDIVRFGPFEADFQAGQLRKHGIKIPVQAQPLQVLAALLESPGKVVTRDELQRRLWADQTFVDFEHGLNVAMTRLRQALGDSAVKPRYIETLAKRGYRFRAQVERAPAVRAEQATGTASGRPQARYWVAASAAMVALAVFVASGRRPQSVNAVGGKPATPLTTFRGSERYPSLSPDGTRVAFAWDGPKRDNIDVYVTTLDAGTLTRLTSHAADDLSPKWSPDGRTIAFLRARGDDRGELMVIPATGGPEHKVREIRNSELQSGRQRIAGLSWSPDGMWIATSHREADESTESIHLFSIVGEARRVTKPSGSFGDQAPAFSPDGLSLAFSRMCGFSASEIYAVPLNAKAEAGGQERSLTTHKRWSVNPVWLPDGKRISYLTAAHPEGPHELRIISATRGTNSATTVRLDNDTREFALGRHLVYSRIRRNAGVWRARIARPGVRPSTAELFIASTQKDTKPVYSPDGQSVAFTSVRSGAPEVWVAKSDGQSPVRRTSFGGPLVGVPNWSADGQWLTFHARPEGQADVFIMPSAGGEVRRLTTDQTDDTMPSFSEDGRWIYFASSRSGQVEIWKMPVAGGAAAQLSTGGGERPIETPGGKNVIYMKLGGAELRSVSSNGGPWTRVVSPIHPYPTGFAVTRRGIYYAAPPHSGPESFIMFLSFGRHASRPVAVATYPFGFGMSVSAGDEYVLFDQEEQVDRDLLVISEFLSGQ